MASCTCANPELVAQKVEATQKQIEKDDKEFHETYYGKEMTESDRGSGSGGSPSKGAAPIRFARWAAPEITDEGEKGWATFWSAIAIAISAANALYQGKIADRQMELGNAYYDMAKYKLDRFMNNYKPLELAMIDDIKATPVREMDCADDRSRATSSVESSYGAATRFSAQQAKKLRICFDQSFNNFMDYRKAIMQADTENFNLIDDQFFVEYKNDQRWNRRSDLLNVGRNMTGEAMSYGDVARQAMNNVNGQLDKVTNSLMTAVGYFGARNDTYYPNAMLSTAGGMNNNLISTSTTGIMHSPSGIAAGV